MKILNFGSLNIDYVYKVDHIVKKGETISSRALNLFSGGKGLNQSVALGRSGVKVYHAGAVGSDGGFLLDILKDAGVDTTYVDILSTVRTGNAIIQNDKDGDNCIILYGGANQMVSKNHIDDVLADFSEGDCLILQNEISNLSYLIEKAHQKRMTIILNPSPMDENVLKLPLDDISYFILNEVEAMQLIGRNDKEFMSGNSCETVCKEELIDALGKKFPNAKIVLTLGQEGSMFTDGKETITQSSYQVKTVDTTGAGDTYTGYFISEIVKGRDVGQAMETAARAASIAVSRAGAAPSIPDMEEVQKFDWKHPAGRQAKEDAHAAEEIA